MSDYDLLLDRGGMHCLAGRSGSGKTSILRVAAGLVPPAAGAVRWAGLEITGLADDVVTTRRRQHVGYLDQRGSLVPGLTALENVLLPQCRIGALERCRVAPGICCTGSVWALAPRTIRTGSPAASVSGSRSPGRCCCSRP
ncbi:ATP-binding cassette domain-containing protein [Microbacterium sp. KUDC0406]|uniref:ATP-binding cassette domain-containing protein n=1 Tax=Microbacterium sp. KUDC0406 TaxID=2909588 RepID=UPI001F172EBE|nr:ATP-binding cassette domain-containing protein [Microbacterium sp. KUDC0406]UJP10466.1 ATP-binding cassette domain-containing protein [Microbacterium sp. KUDC0406]